MMRLLEGGGGSDVQALEAAALRDHADLLLEVVRQPSPSAALDSVFQIRVKEIGSGRLVLSLTSDGEAAAEQGGARFEPGARGFVRVARPSHEVARAVGEQLALETMDALAGHWAR